VGCRRVDSICLYHFEGTSCANALPEKLYRDTCGLTTFFHLHPELHLPPTRMLSHLQKVLEKLEAIAHRAGITFLFELH
jgi:hypothetical protein